MSKKEHELKQNLIGVMAEQGLDRHKLPDGRVVMVIGKKNVKISKPKSPKKAKAA